MRSQKTHFLLLAALLVLPTIATVTLTGWAQDRSSSHGREIPTPVQEGQLTAKQMWHSKLFKRYDTVTGGRKLRDLVAERGDVEVVRVLGDVLVPANFSIQTYLNNLTCRADAVVVGTVDAKSSQLIEEGTFIFTDYELLVEEVFKSPPASIEQNANITVTRVGGFIGLNGHAVRAIDHNQERLRVGERYLLYLRSIPATGSFQAFANSASEDTFQISGRNIKQTSGKAMPLGKRSIADVDLFLTQAKLSIQSPCGKEAN